jgi:hypothetical protein
MKNLEKNLKQWKKKKEKTVHKKTSFRDWLRPRNPGLDTSDINLLVIHRNQDSGQENNFIKNINIDDLKNGTINKETFLDFDNIDENKKVNWTDLPVHLRIESKKEFKFLLEDNEFKDKPQNFDINAFLI